MKSFALVLALVAIIGLATASPNPGLVVDVRRQIFLDFINEYFLTVMSNFENIQIPEMELQGIKLNDVTANVTNDSPANVRFDFNATQNALIVGLSKTSVDVAMKWKYNALLSGNAQVSGPVKTAVLNVGFTQTEKDGFSIPQFSLNKFDFALDHDAFKINLDCKLCPQFLVNLLISIMKGSLLTNIEDTVKSIVSEELFDNLNTALYTSYPTTVNVTDELGVCTALIESINIENDHLELPLDLTFFLLSQGYSRHGDGPVVPRYDTEHPGEIMTFLSSYVTDSIVNVVNQKPLSFPFKALFLNMNLHLLGPDYPTSIKMNKNNLQISASPVLDTGFLKVSFAVEFEASLDASIELLNNHVDMFEITPQLKGLKLQKFQMIFLGIPFNLSIFRYVLNGIVSLIVNHILLPTFKVPNLPGLDSLRATDSLLNVQDDYVEFGVSFAFEHLKRIGLY